jgi:hypothetical protein
VRNRAFQGICGTSFHFTRLGQFLLESWRLAALEIAVLVVLASKSGTPGTLFCRALLG